MTKVLDIKQSITAANGNVSLAKELFTMLLDDLSQRFHQIETSHNEQKLELLAEHVHKLYGATAYCIVPQLREQTSVLEDKLREKDYTKIDGLVTSVLNEIQNVIDAGPEFINKNWKDYKVEE